MIQVGISSFSNASHLVSNMRKQQKISVSDFKDLTLQIKKLCVHLLYTA